MRTLKLIARFYRGIFVANFLVTAVSVFAIASHRHQANKLIGTFFWGKLITLALMIYFAFVSRRKELYYYQNLGLSKQKLALTMGSADFAFWLVLILLSYILVS
ncbi:MAG TPA: hypothetical protein VL490_01965 [Mucilaginibacter sp.]|nr:hypothetical protein [Mucilaginibacter sp.]